MSLADDVDAVADTERAPSYCSWCRGEQRPDCRHLEPSTTAMWASEWREDRLSDRNDFADEYARSAEDPE